MKIFKENEVYGAAVQICSSWLVPIKPSKFSSVALLSSHPYSYNFESNILWIGIWIQDVGAKLTGT